MRARPITAPAAENAPTIPMMRPRMILDCETDFHPWMRDWPTFSLSDFLDAAPFGISLRPRIVHAAKRNDAALI